MKMYTTEVLVGKEYEQLGLVSGNAVYVLNIGKQINIGMQALGGGLVDEITDKMNETKKIAELRIKYEAKLLNADAIVGLRINCSSAGSGLYVEYYGTAIKFK